MKKSHTNHPYPTCRDLTSGQKSRQLGFGSTQTLPYLTLPYLGGKNTVWLYLGQKYSVIILFVVFKIHILVIFMISLVKSFVIQLILFVLCIRFKSSLITVEIKWKTIKFSLVLLLRSLCLICYAFIFIFNY